MSPLYGRRDVPGEPGIRDIVDQRSVLNRTIRAQVVDSDPTNGYAILTYESLPGGGRYATTAPLWMSFPEAASGSGPAWGRYMPQQGDLVRVAFDYDDSPYIVGYDIAANKDGVGDGNSGWPQLNDQYESAAGNPDVKPERAKFAQFTPLNQGEYDFMSSGGAYIYGNNRGRLYLAGGAVSVSMIKNDLRMDGRAQLWTHLADDCEFRFGQVRRLDPVDQTEKSLDQLGLVNDPDGLFKEFSVNVQNSAVPGAPIGVSSLKIGNVVDDLGMSTLNDGSGIDSRFNYVAYNDLGIKSLSMSIDKLGNWEMLAPLAAVGVNFDFSLSDWTTSFANITHTASITYTISSPSINLGAAATHPLLLTNIYRPAEDILFNGIVSSITALGVVVATLGASITAAAGPLATPIIGGTMAAPVFAAAGLAASLAAPLATSIAQEAAATFTAPENTYLSEVSRTQ